MREIKIRAAREDRKLKELIPELLEKGLASDAAPTTHYRVQFPLIKGTRTPPPEEQLSPDDLAQILLDQEVEWLTK